MRIRLNLCRIYLQIYIPDLLYQSNKKGFFSEDIEEMVIVKCSSSSLRMKISANMYIPCEISVHENLFNCRK